MIAIDSLIGTAIELMVSASVRSLCLALAVALLIVVFRLRNAPLQHALWTVVLASMLLLPVAGYFLPPLRIPVPLPKLAPVAKALSPVVRARPIVINATTGVVSDPGARPATAGPASVWLRWLAAFYVGGVLLFLLRLGIGTFLSYRLIARSTSLRDTPANQVLQDIATEYPLPGLYETGEVAVPVVVSGDQPAILLPCDWTSWSEWNLRAVLAHELAHVRRGDSTIVSVAAINRCLFWFHPLAWWLEKRLAVLAESASDDAAVCISGDRSRYAELLLEISVAAAGRRLLPSPITHLSMAGTTPMATRIHRVLDSSRTSTGSLSRRAWVLLIGCAIPLFTALAAAQVTPPVRTPISPSQADVPAEWNWAVDGHRTSAADAERLEQQLNVNAHDLNARARLVAHYLYNAQPDQLSRHVLWVIENRPDTSLAGSEPTWNYPRPDPMFERKRELWLAQVSRFPNNVQVIANAAQFLSQSDQSTAERLLQQALTLEPANPIYSRRLAQLYSSSICVAAYVRAGLQPVGPWIRVEEQFAFSAADRLRRSTDGALAGAVGSELAAFIAYTTESRTNQQHLVDEARRQITSDADQLLRRAEALQPGNPQWAAALKLLHNPPRPSSPGASQSTQSPADRTSDSTAARIRVPAKDQASQLIESPPPEYPALARQARIQGTVRLSVVIGTDGRIRTAQVIAGHPLLVPPALEAIKHYSYKPTLVDGRLTEVETQLDVNFTLDR